jgi:hypothetical protein
MGVRDSALPDKIHILAARKVHTSHRLVPGQDMEINVRMTTPTYHIFALTVTLGMVANIESRTELRYLRAKTTINFPQSFLPDASYPVAKAFPSITVPITTRVCGPRGLYTQVRDWYRVWSNQSPDQSSTQRLNQAGLVATLDHL